MKKTRSKLKKVLVLMLASVLILTGCSSGKSNTESSQKTATVSPAADSGKNAEVTSAASSASSASNNTSTRIFVDSAGRKVEIPTTIKSIAPSGPLANIVLYTACPDLLAGIAAEFSDDAKQYIDKKYWSLPVFGQFYGKNANLNMEELVKNSPDVIVDIGEAKDTIKEDMDSLQKQLGIPCVFIKASIDTMPDCYTKLGELTGLTDRAKQLSEYCQNTIDQAKQVTAKLSDKDKVKVYIAMGDAGFNTNAEKSFHSQPVVYSGADNVADIEATPQGGGSEVSYEQLVKWNPDVIICDGEQNYKTVTTDKVWKGLDAVKNKKVYRIPDVPYGFLFNPPAVNGIIGIKWLGNLLYPDKYNIDINKEVKEFYKLFYSIDLSDEQLAKIMTDAHK
jgi:iron complex transport system substrate-binding protein